MKYDGDINKYGFPILHNKTWTVGDLSNSVVKYFPNVECIKLPNPYRHNH